MVSLYMKLPGEKKIALVNEVIDFCDLTKQIHFPCPLKPNRYYEWQNSDTIPDVFPPVSDIYIVLQRKLKSWIQV